MHHIAIMKKSWGLIPKILSGEKTIESRWYKNRVAPWNKVHAGDIVYFKNSGEPVTAKAVVTKVEQFEISNNEEALNIMRDRARADLGTTEIPEEVRKYTQDKRYAIFVHFKDAETIQPFEIDKTGFGTQTAWLAIKDVRKIRKGNKLQRD